MVVVFKDRGGQWGRRRMHSLGMQSLYVPVCSFYVLAERSVFSIFSFLSWNQWHGILMLLAPTHYYFALSRKGWNAKMNFTCGVLLLKDKYVLYKLYTKFTIGAY